MKQNKYFNPGRFYRLFENDLLIHKKTYLSILIGLLIGVYGITLSGMWNRYNPIIIENFYIPNFMFLMLGILIFISSSFPDMKNRVTINSYLLLPASTLEKFLVQFVTRIILLIPIAMILFWVAIYLAKASLIPDPSINFDPSKIQDFNFRDLFKYVPKFRDKVFIVSGIFSVACALFAGATHFNRFALVKTVIVSAILGFAVYFLLVVFSHIFYPIETHGFEVHLDVYKISGDITNINLCLYLVSSISWLFFLPLAYFKLKEKEV